jgi:imidazoleglycerol phosphate synthase glutamine amidotransferase subunit HisH
VSVNNTLRQTAALEVDGIIAPGVGFMLNCMAAPAETFRRLAA